MGERKVVNKFVPWDFDPDKVAKVKLSNIGQFSVRMMLPFTVRCNSCGEFMYAGKKFNTRKENANGEDYLGISIQRFYFKCSNCGAEFAIKTDPKSSSYLVESGATRNSNIQLNERQQELEDQRLKDEVESMDAIKALENRTEEMKRELDIYDSLDMVLAQTRKSMNTDPEDALELIRLREEKKKKLEEKKEEDAISTKDLEEMLQLIKEKKERETNLSESSFSNAFSKVKVLPIEQTVKKLATPKNGVKVTMKKKKCTNMDPDTENYSVFAANGDVVYIEDNWKEGEEMEIILPFDITCDSCSIEMQKNTRTTIYCVRSEEQLRSESFACKCCKSNILLKFDEVDELMRITGASIVKNMEKETISDNEMIDTDNSDKSEQEVDDENSIIQVTNLKVLTPEERPKSFFINGMKVTIKSKRKEKRSEVKKQTAKYYVC